ncbi:hypothetical protein CspHIS471_0211730 [Cutaneotrichosporon sp. HIS471]|nr:hypothetical protein CspHIS471_0211730 [Cutaneotrichosporon sp. HIS471]
MRDAYPVTITATPKGSMAALPDLPNDRRACSKITPSPLPPPQPSADANPVKMPRYQFSFDGEPITEDPWTTREDYSPGANVDNTSASDTHGSDAAEHHFPQVDNVSFVFATEDDLAPNTDLAPTENAITPTEHSLAPRPEIHIFRFMLVLVILVVLAALCALEYYDLLPHPPTPPPIRRATRSQKVYMTAGHVEDYEEL